MADSINVEVNYALPYRQELVRLTLPAGATVREAVDASGLLQKYPDIDLDGRCLRRCHGATLPPSSAPRQGNLPFPARPSARLVT